MCHSPLPPAPDKLWFPCYPSVLEQCAGSGLPHPSGLHSLFLCLFYIQAVFLCLLVLLALFQAWQSEGVEFRLVRASPLFFSAVNMCLLVLLDILRRLPDDMYGNTDEVNGTSGEILKILIYIGTSGKSYFQNLFWSVGESWKLLKLYRMCLYTAGSILSFAALPPTPPSWQVFGAVYPEPQLILNRACLDFIWHGTSFYFSCFPLPFHFSSTFRVGCI